MRRRACDALPRLRWMLLSLCLQPARAADEVLPSPPSLPPPEGDSRNLWVVALAALGCALGGAMCVFILVSPIIAQGPRPARTNNKRDEPSVRVASGGGFTGLDDIRIEERIEEGSGSPERGGAESCRSSEWSSAGCCLRQPNGSSFAVDAAGEEIVYH